MMVSFRWLVFAAVVAFLVLPCHGQELDVFELTDFVDPRLRGLEFLKTGEPHDSGVIEFEVVKPGSDMLYVRGVFGGAANYSNRTDPTRSDVSFLHLASTFYSGLKQYNVKATMFEPNDARLGSAPRLRLTGQVASYGFSYMADAETGQPQEVSDRYVIAASVEDTERCTSQTGCTRGWDSELSFQADTSLDPRRGRDSEFGSFLLGIRRTAEGDTDYRGTVAFHFLEKDYERFRLGALFDHSLERSNGSLHWGATRLGMSASFKLADRFTLHGVWLPAYVPKEPGRRVYHEVAFFIDTRVYARMFPPAGSQR